MRVLIINHAVLQEMPSPAALPARLSGRAVYVLGPRSPSTLVIHLLVPTKREPNEEEREKIGALSVTLSEEELAALETSYVPHAVAGFE